MKRKKTGCILAVLILLLGVPIDHAYVFSSTLSVPKDLYWVAFLHLNPVGQEQVFLMQIDALGNITAPPRGVVPINQIGQSLGAVALAKGTPNRIVLWLSKRTLQGVPAITESGFILKALVSNPNLQFLSVRKTNIKTSNVHWTSVTQKDTAQNLLALAIESGSDNFLTGLGLSFQSLNGSSWLLSPSICAGDLCKYGLFGGTVSSDGKFALVISERRLFMQRLSSTAKPTGHMQLIHAIPAVRGSPFYSGIDITGPLEQGKRFVVFGTQISGADEGSEKIFLQVVSGSANTIGERIQLMDGAALDSNSGSIIAIDPKGRFFLAAVTSIPNQQESNLLIFQALDKTGHPSGNPRVIANNVVSAGIDILKE